MINLEYGQQAVARGFLTPQRLQQVLAKQRTLNDEGKKVSIRMILEKSKLLTPQQLEQVDRDLNIKVVKKKTGVVDRAAPPARGGARPVSASNFAGDDDLPDVSGSKGVNPDATLYSPPPADMQERIRVEREKAKQAVRQKQEQQAEGFMEPEPFADPEPFAQEEAPSLDRLDSSPKLKSLRAEQFGFASPESEELPMVENEPLPMQPMGGGFDQYGQQSPMQELPQDAGFGFDQPDQGFGNQGGFAQPQMEAEPEPFAADAGFGGGQDFAAAQPEQGGGFDAWGEEQPQAAGGFDAEPPMGGDLNATVFSPPPPAMPRDINATVFSPPPPGLRPGTRSMQPSAPPPPPPMDEPEPQGFDAWGEEAPAEPAGFDAPAFDAPEPAPAADIGATLYSPPPPGMRGSGRNAPPPMPEPEPAEEMAAPEPFGADEGFGEREPEMAPDEEPVAASSAPMPPAPKKPSEPVKKAEPPAPKKPEPVAAKKPPTAEEELPPWEQPEEEAAPAKAKTAPPPAPVPGKGKLPEPAKEPASKVQAKPQPVAKAQPAKAPAATAVAEAEPEGEQPKKKTAARVLLWFTILLLIVVALLVLPVALPDQPQLKTLRQVEQLKPIYAYVEKIFEPILPKKSTPLQPTPLPSKEEADKTLKEKK